MFLWGSGGGFSDGGENRFDDQIDDLIGKLLQMGVNLIVTGQSVEGVHQLSLNLRVDGYLRRRKRRKREEEEEEEEQEEEEGGRGGRGGRVGGKEKRRKRSG